MAQVFEPFVVRHCAGGEEARFLLQLVRELLVFRCHISPSLIDTVSTASSDASFRYVPDLLQCQAVDPAPPRSQCGSYPGSTPFPAARVAVQEGCEGLSA